MQPPSEPEQHSESGDASAMTEDKEVADWVHRQTELRAQKLHPDAKKPALHAVALDKVARSPIHEDPFTSSQQD